MNKDGKEYVPKEEYDALLRKYNQVNMKLYNLKSRKFYKLARKLEVLKEKINLNKITSNIIKTVGVNKLLFNNFTLSKIDKLTLAEYKFFRYKRTRTNNFYIDSSKINFYYEKDKVSIIIPVDREVYYLKSAIKSALDQTYKNIELLVITSNKKSISDILSEFNDDRLKVIEINKNELHELLNEGLKNTSGEYILWFECVNKLYEDCVEKMVNYLKKNPKVDFTFVNVKLITEDNGLYRQNDWYNKDGQNLENAILPHNMLNLCIEKKNYVSPICMFKAIVSHTLVSYSKNRQSLENRDFWMRANDLFIINHIDTDEPLAYFRMQNLQPSPKKYDNKKMSILMLFEAYRQDFYSMPLLWVVDNQDKHQKLVDEINKREHMLIDSKKANTLYLNDVYNNMIYVYFGDDDNIGKIPDSAYKVCISKKQFKECNNANLYICVNKDENVINIDNDRGFYQIDDYDTIFKFIDAKAREYFMKRIEDYVEDRDRKEEHPISVCVVTYKRTEKVPIVIESLLNQSEPRENFEILIVNNDIYTNDILDLVNEFRKKYKLSDKFLRYVEAPIKGVSYARNVGTFEAHGDIIHWLDDDSISDYNNVHEMKEAFKQEPNASVIGGNIILKLPEPRPEIVLPGKEKLWSEWYYEGDKMVKLTKWFKFPYGANYATIKKDLLRVGGFRMCYGRVGHNWVGGEETSSTALIRRLGKDIYAAPKAIVHHDPQIHRYSYEHVKNTLNASPSTNLKLEQDLIVDPEYHNIDVTKRGVKYHKKQVRKLKNKVEKFYEKELLEGHKRGLKALKNEMNERVRYTKYRKDMTYFITKKN